MLVFLRGPQRVSTSSPIVFSYDWPKIAPCTDLENELGSPGRILLLKKFNPHPGVSPNIVYSHGVEVPAGARWLHIAGQVGMRPDGSLPEDAEGQFEQAWQNVLAVLEGAGMGPEDLVSVNAYITNPDDIELSRGFFTSIGINGGFAATMVTVARLSHPDWVVEVQAVAAKV